MTGVAERGLRLRQQKLGGLGVVGGMAGDAAYVVLAVHGINGIFVFDGRGVARHAAIVNFLCRVARKNKYLRLISAASDVRRAGPMASLTTLVRRATFRIEGGFPVRGLLPSVVDFFVTGLAHLNAQVV
jgi:hypothetical protein